jgi:diglucosylglycerate octanoyltransferase
VASLLRLVVIGDSTAFTDDRGPQLPDEPTLYPNVLARTLEQRLDREVDLTVVARPGLAVRETWRMLTKDRHVQFEVLAGADAVVVGIGSFDHAPGGIPPVVDAITPFVRPAGLRRRVRRAVHRAYPWAVRATGWRLRRTPAGEFERLYDQVLLQIRSLARGAAGVVLGPTSHRAPFYAYRHPGHATAEAQQLAIAERHGFARVSCWDHARDHVDRLNVDGIHWPADVHAAVAADLAEALVEQLGGHASRPPTPDLNQSG